MFLKLLDLLADWRAPVFVVVVVLVWALYRLFKRYSRKCKCGCWFWVERIKILEFDTLTQPDPIFGQRYIVYVLGKCHEHQEVHTYKIYSRFFTPIELWWRYLAHSDEFHRADAHDLMHRAHIDLGSHAGSEGQKVGNKPQLKVEIPQPTINHNPVKAAQKGRWDDTVHIEGSLLGHPAVISEKRDKSNTPSEKLVDSNHLIRLIHGNNPSTH